MSSLSAPPAHFNPRSPWGERPAAGSKAGVFFQISIHAPRGGSDYIYTDNLDEVFDFNPRSPWGERLAPAKQPSFAGEFQSTLPVGGATRNQLPEQANRRISIHAPRGGSDL